MAALPVRIIVFVLRNVKQHIGHKKGSITILYSNLKHGITIEPDAVCWCVTINLPIPDEPEVAHLQKHRRANILPEKLNVSIH